MNELSVLLVEDDIDDEWFALWVLTRLGIENVAVSRDGYEAVSSMKEAAQLGENFLPDLVLLGLELQKLNGLEVLRRLRQEPATASLNVVILSAYEDPEALAACRSLGALACFPKPLPQKCLLPILQSLPRPSAGGRRLN